MRGDRTGSARRSACKQKKKKGRIAAFMYANQLFIQHIVKTRERGERDGTRAWVGGEAGAGEEGMQQQARVIDVKRVHSCLDVVILNGRRMNRSCAAIRLSRVG